MAEAATEQILKYIDNAREQYYRLVIVAAPSGSGKTALLRDVHKQTEFPLINVNLELSRRMLDLTEAQRSLHLPRILDDIVRESESDVVLFDNIELLFDPSLNQDPLRLLQKLSRNRTIVVAWSGVADEKKLTYASIDHAEFRRYSIDDLLLVRI